MNITYNLCAGIAFVHSRMVIHRDLKPANILLGKRDEFWYAVIADFGNSAIVQQIHAASGACAAAGGGANSVARWAGCGSALSRNVCTLWYAAPEMLVPGEGYGYPVDVWSLGLVLIEVEWGDVVCPTKGDSCNPNAEQLQILWCFCLPSPMASGFVRRAQKELFATQPAARSRCAASGDAFEGVGKVYGWRFREFALRLVQFDPQVRVCANSLHGLPAHVPTACDLAVWLVFVAHCERKTNMLHTSNIHIKYDTVYDDNTHQYHTIIFITMHIVISSKK